jgi:hypothetical protein
MRAASCGNLTEVSEFEGALLAQHDPGIRPNPAGCHLDAAAQGKGEIDGQARVELAMADAAVAREVRGLEERWMRSFRSPLAAAEGELLEVGVDWYRLLSFSGVCASEVQSEALCCFGAKISRHVADRLLRKHGPWRRRKILKNKGFSVAPVSD